ncbi:MAG: restriction endonuclease subunit S, partial [Oscillibacter sp.]|nr:restriction endonuclease subunit S [Oscillibacter sp.]
MMEVKSIAEINCYAGSSVNPLNTPETLYELYSVPSFDSQYPEIIKGADIGSAKITVEEGDVLICKINPRINRVWVVQHHTEYPLLASSEWIVIRNQEIDSNYLKWYFSSPFFRKMIVSQVAGIGGSLTRAQPKQVAKYPVPIPDFATQKAISSVLEKLDFLVFLRKSQLAELDELIRARFVEMFGDLKYNSMDWPVDKFNDFATIDTTMIHDFTEYGDYPHIGIDSIEKDTGNLSGYRTVKEDGVISGKYLFTPEHIIYSKIRPNLNKVALPDFIGVCSADAYPILPKKGKCNRVFLAYTLRSPVFLDYILAFSNRTNLPKVNKQQVEGFC